MIRLQGVVKRFRSHEVLKGIDLRMGQGDRIALIGSNGAGKTTLIRCLLGEYGFEGAISVGGESPRANRQAVLAQVGFVPQLPPPLKMPVGQLIRFAARVCSADPAAINAVADQLGFDVDRYRRHSFNKLSGGQKQKLLISIAFGRDVRLLVLDEPAANLDPAARARFYELLAERQHDTAMLISSHRLDEVATLVNRVVEMDQGKVTLDDRVADEISLTSQLRCAIALSRPDEAFSKAVREWGFEPGTMPGEWEGTVAGPDRLRFLGMLSRYAGLLTVVRMDEAPASPRLANHG